ncbi:MAG: hypothetical protein KDJ52_01230 [Anaerolineae bacterium]|nr:hypothetical protein [Anaerolineae bacterium]
MGNVRNKIVLKVGLQGLFLLLCLLVLQPQPMNYAQDFPDVCQESENILQNCDFSQGLNHWEPFLETGSADISVLQGGGECHAPLCPAAYIVSANHFIGGIKQQVSVEKGRNYYANIVWLVFDSLVNDASINKATGGIGRRIGIDPFGGTDSTSSNVVWSEDNWRNDCKICNVEYVTVTAQADTITVFLRIDDTWKLRASEQGFPIPPSNDKFWIDDLGLKPVGGEPIAVEEPAPTEEPTATPVPPTDTPAPTEEPETGELQRLAQVESTEEPAVSDEAAEAEASDEAVEEADVAEESSDDAAAEPTEEATGEPTEQSESATSEPTNTPIPPPPTLTPTNIPPPTATSPPRPSPTLRSPGSSLALAGDAEASSAMPLSLNTVGTLGCIGGLGLAFVGAMMAGLVWLYRLGWGQKETDAEFESENVYNDDVGYEDDDDDDYYDDDDDAYDDDEA